MYLSLVLFLSFTSLFSRDSKSVAFQVLKALARLKMVEKDKEGGCKLNTSGTEGSGQNIQTGGGCQHGALEQINAGLINATFIKKKTKDFVEKILHHVWYISFLHQNGSVQSGEMIHMNIRETEIPYLHLKCNTFANSSRGIRSEMF